MSGVYSIGDMYGRLFTTESISSITFMSSVWGADSYIVIDTIA